MPDQFGYFTITRLFVGGFFQSIQYRLITKGKSGLQLPDVRSHVLITEVETYTLGRKMKRVIDLLLFWNPGPCFYRSFTILYVLRALGIRIDLHFGLLEPFLEKRKDIKAHCWLSINGELFLENRDVLSRYPTFLGKNTTGVWYWGNDEEIAYESYQ